MAKKASAKTITLRDGNLDKATKKRNKAREAALADATKELSETDVDIDNVKSKFESSLKRSKKRLANIPEDDSKHQLAYLKAMMLTMQAIIPIAEKQFKKKKDGRATYPLVSLMKEFRETMLDYRQLKNNDAVAEHIIDNIIAPNLKVIMQSFVQSCQDMKMELSRKDRKLVNDMMQSHAKFVTSVLMAVTDSIHQYYKKN